MTQPISCRQRCLSMRETRIPRSCRPSSNPTGGSAPDRDQGSHPRPSPCLRPRLRGARQDERPRSSHSYFETARVVFLTFRHVRRWRFMRCAMPCLGVVANLFSHSRAVNHVEGYFFRIWSCRMGPPGAEARTVDIRMHGWAWGFTGREVWWRSAVECRDTGTRG